MNAGTDTRNLEDFHVADMWGAPFEPFQKCLRKGGIRMHVNTGARLDAAQSFVHGGEFLTVVFLPSHVRSLSP